MEEKKNQWKKKAAVGVVAAAASASVLVGGAFDSPADLLSTDGGDDNNSSAPVLHTLSAQTAQPAAVNDPGDDASDENDGERRQRFPAVRRWILGLPIGVRALVGVPLWAAGWAITSGLALLWEAALSPLGGKILAWVLAAVAAILVFALTAKALFPNAPWKKILRPRNILILLVGMVVLGATDTLLDIFWEDYPPVGQAARLIGGAVMITAACLATRKLMRRWKPEPAPAPEEEAPAPQPTVEEQAMALADSVCPQPVHHFQ